jgi:serine-type D-Ala-D-Ala carboxypeptidase/endopeptidase (penicillin-binding protein 4)
MRWPSSGRPAVQAVPWLLSVALLAGCHAQAPPVTTPSAPATATGALQRDLDRILLAPALAHGYWGVEVRSLTTGRTLYSRNAERLLLPASNMKILTLAVAAQQLGWDFRFDTQLLAAGTIANGTLDGDLIVVGSGDPTIVDRDGSAAALFADWATRLRQAGVGTIRGRIVGDGGAFAGAGFGAGWTWDDLSAGYGAGVSALQYNDNIAGLTITPGASPGTPALIAVDPAETGLEVVNLVRTAAAASPSQVTIQRLAGSARLELRGTVALHAAPIARTVSVENPTQFFVASLRDALIANGIAVEGPAVDIETLPSPPTRDGAVSLVTHRSAPLADMAIRMMRLSENLYAETLLETLGLRSGDPTAAGGLSVARGVLETWGVPASSVLQADGSGLSRYDYVTPSAIVDVLTHVERDDRLRGPFVDALPVPGEDGTLDNRLGALASRIRAKTGSMTGVRTLSGYLTTAGGEQLVFSFLGNNFDVPGSVIDDAIDACVVRLATIGG